MPIVDAASVVIGPALPFKARHEPQLPRKHGLFGPPFRADALGMGDEVVDDGIAGTAFSSAACSPVFAGACSPIPGGPATKP